MIEWLLFKPLGWVARQLRTDYSLDGQTLTVKRPFRETISVAIEDLDEVGVETTDQGPFAEDIFWILTKGRLRLRIGDPHPVFHMLMDRFKSLEGFDWQPFIEAMSCCENRYSPCWRRHQVSG